MAELVVMGEYQGPGERKTAERLAVELPPDWAVFAGRKLPGEQRADLDLVVVGGHGIFVLEEKAWGPTVFLEDALWFVKGEARRNPVDRVAHLSRVLAGRIKTVVPGYSALPGRGHRVISGVVLSHDRLELKRGPLSSPDELVLPLAEAGTALRERDTRFPEGFGTVRQTIIDFLRGLPARDRIPARLGPYLIRQTLPPVGRAQCFLATNDAEPVVLRCYPLHGWGAGEPPLVFIQRETKVLRRLADLGRAWRPSPTFVDDAHQWLVVPLVPPADGRNLDQSQRKLDPPRPAGKLPEAVQRKVAADAFKALAAVHDEKIVHRGLHPRRIELGRGLRVRFSDFYLARLSGSETITPWLGGIDADLGVPYRAPECRAEVRYAVPASDVYSLALSLAMWMCGDLSQTGTEPDVKTLRTSLSGLGEVGTVLKACLAESAAKRPTAAKAAERLIPPPDITAPRPPVKPPIPTTTTVFAEGETLEGRYLLKRKLGAGGNATTWLGYDMQHQDSYVIKQFHDAQTAGLARQEFAAAKLLAHDRCARVWSIYETPAPGFLVHQYIEGVSLAEASNEVALDLATIKQVATDLLDALSYIHDKNLVHGDISPSNIIVTPGGNGVLIDFGLAGQSGSVSGGGTPLVMAPEILRAESANAATDLYSLAASLLFTMLGRPPYAGDPTEGPTRDVTPVPPSADERAQWKEEGSAVLDALFSAIAPDPADRPTDATTLAGLLRAARSRPDVVGTRAINPTVESLRRLYRGSTAGNAGNRGLDDEFSRQTYVPTRLDTDLLPAILDGKLNAVLLTGNPGDGKTSFLVTIGQELRDRGAIEISSDAAGWRLDLHGHRYVAVFDASESHGKLTSDDLVAAALTPLADEHPSRHTALVAINDGRLLQFLTDHEDRFGQLAGQVRQQMDGAAPADGVVLVDLKRRSLATLDGAAGSASAMAGSFTDPQRWSSCTRCLSRTSCPILANAEDLRGPAAKPFGELVLTSHLRRRRRATFRDVRSALAWLITADRSCEDVHADRERGLDVTWYPARIHDLAFAAESDDYLIQEWSDVDPALIAAPEVERAARLDARLTPDPARFDRKAASTALRQFFLGTWAVPGLETSAVRAYRHLDEFIAILLHPARSGGLERILLGMSRIAGAPGFQDAGMALGDRNESTRWAVLSQVPASHFQLVIDAPASPFAESIPDRITLQHSGGASLSFSLDTAELVLRAADGEVLADVDSDAVRQEIDGFTARVGYEGAHMVQIVDPVGRLSRARQVDQSIRLEQIR